MKLVCIPALNAEKTIGIIVKKSLRYVDEVIVCDDGSSDDTTKVAKDNGAQVIVHDKNQGYGAALITLFEHARKKNADVMITLDSDGQHDPDEISKFLDKIQGKKIDVIIGSRFLNNKKNLSAYRKAGIKVITSTLNLGNGLKITDSQSGFRAYSKKALEEINITEKGMSASSEILQKAANKNLTMSEVPITVSYEGNTSTQNSVSHGTGVLINTIKFISVKHPLTYFGIPGIIIFISGILVGNSFLENYLTTKELFLGSLYGSIVLILIGMILSATAIMLFAIATLIKQQK